MSLAHLFIMDDLLEEMRELLVTKRADFADPFPQIFGVLSCYGGFRQRKGLPKGHNSPGDKVFFRKKEAWEWIGGGIPVAWLSSPFVFAG